MQAPEVDLGVVRQGTHSSLCPDHGAGVTTASGQGQDDQHLFPKFCVVGIFYIPQNHYDYYVAPKSLGHSRRDRDNCKMTQEWRAPRGAGEGAVHQAGLRHTLDLVTSQPRVLERVPLAL